MNQITIKICKKKSKKKKTCYPTPARSLCQIRLLFFIPSVIISYIYMGFGCSLVPRIKPVGW